VEGFYSTKKIKHLIVVTTHKMSEPEEKKPRVVEDVTLQRVLDLNVEDDPMAELMVRMADVARSLIREIPSELSGPMKRRLVAIQNLLPLLPSSLNMPADKNVEHHYVLFEGCYFGATLAVVDEPFEHPVELFYRTEYQKIVLRHERWKVSIVRKLNM
jgi:hypothetical protein